MQGPRPKTAAKIEYFTSSDSAPGEEFRSPWDADTDDPASDGFIPMEDRTPQQQARWWAMQSRRNKGRPAAGIM